MPSSAADVSTQSRLVIEELHKMSTRRSIKFITRASSKPLAISS
ncbi:hypothetical protein L915_03531 [Phytophthora nicotianae]|uniref:Uncharacterized protein n=1 Tax=Phytophthora nicotianae TaxID=4792 RepID=W2HDA9_PHYNI|nr:hypothetical protein L915_03531 [Phytophthora nicotianae]ETL46657.1 hypothetical protein L916_03479 [Phytophthora nicotianae]